MTWPSSAVQPGARSQRSLYGALLGLGRPGLGAVEVRLAPVVVNWGKRGVSKWSGFARSHFRRRGWPPRLFLCRACALMSRLHTHTHRTRARTGLAVVISTVSLERFPTSRPRKENSRTKRRKTGFLLPCLTLGVPDLQAGSAGGQPAHASFPA